MLVVWCSTGSSTAVLATEVASLPAILLPICQFASVLVGPFARLGFLVLAVVAAAVF